MLTRTQYREVCEIFEPPPPPVPLAKGQCILVKGKVYYIMAKLSADAEHPITYNICDENLTNPQFGLQLEGIESSPEDGLTEIQKRRARNFV